MALALAGLAAEAAAAAPRVVCYPVMPGDSLSALSVRLMRDPHGWRGDRFQLLDPAAARFLAKRDYWQIRAGLQACVMEPSSALTSIPGGDWWLLLLLSSASAAGFYVLQSSMDRRKATSAALQAFGAAFVREFERPLLDERSPQPVLRSELALSRDQRSLEVLLAPIDGRRYPNLADHRTNVEYDVERVMSVLNDGRFTRGPLGTRGSWVAIPFRLQPDRPASVVSGSSRTSGIGSVRLLAGP